MNIFTTEPRHAGLPRWRRLSVLIAGLGLGLGLSGAALAQDRFGDPPAVNPAPGSGSQPGQRPGGSAPQGYGQANNPAPAQTGNPADAERRDMGVAPPAGLHSGAMHGPTPNSIPGGQLVTTQGLVSLLARRDVKALVFDVLGGPETLPEAQFAVPAHQPGSFDDQTQREFGQYLKQVTQGRQDTPLVFYCASVQCWMSYNAALRAIRMGFSNVLWYRGGLEAWKAAGQPVRRQGGMPGGPTGGQNGPGAGQGNDGTRPGGR